MPKLDQPQKSEEKKVEEKADALAQKEKELREEEKVPFILAYRDNKLFQEYVPVIEDFLKEQGYPVSIQSFPVGTPPEEIKKWFEEHKSELEGKNILCDNTFESATLYFNCLKTNADLYLDSIMYGAMIKAITGDRDGKVERIVDQDLVKKVRDLKNAYPKNEDELKKLELLEDELEVEFLAEESKIYKEILSNIPKEEKQKEFVIIKGTLEEEFLIPILISHDLYFSENKKKWVDQTNRFAEMLQTCFKEAGISKVTCVARGAEIPPEIMEKMKKGEAYVIWDRHGVMYFGNRLMNSHGAEFKAFWGSNFEDATKIRFEDICLPTPLADFCVEATRKFGLKYGFTFNGHPERMEKAIKDELQKKIDENIEKKKKVEK
jgi:hypothetical protein